MLEKMNSWEGKMFIILMFVPIWIDIHKTAYFFSDDAAQEP